MEIVWDVARVFLSTTNPTILSKRTVLNAILPPFLLNAFENFIVAADIPEKERGLVMTFSRASIYDFLTSHCYDINAKKVLQNQFSFIQLHRKTRDRKSSPLRSNYDPAYFSKLVETNPTILPVLILDFLHVLVIRFSGFLIESTAVKLRPCIFQ